MHIHVWYVYSCCISCESEVSTQVLGTVISAGVFPRIPLLDADQGHRMTHRNRPGHGDPEIAASFGRKLELTRLGEVLNISALLAMWEISDFQVKGLARLKREWKMNKNGNGSTMIYGFGAHSCRLAWLFDVPEDKKCPFFPCVSSTVILDLSQMSFGLENASSNSILNALQYISVSP